MNAVGEETIVAQRPARMTWLLIAINVIVYLVMEYRGGPTYETLLAFGAKENGLIAEGEYIRLFIPMFLHAGILHLGFNMYGLFLVGRFLEWMTGARTLLMVYVVSGVTANLCSFAFSTALSVGASGSLFGILLTLYMIERFERRVAKESNLQIRTTRLGPLILMNAVITFVIPNIDWANHLGGSIAGVFLGQAIAMRHQWMIRVLRASRYLSSSSPPLQRKLWETETLYFVALFLVNVGFASSISRVTFAERSFGRGVQLASQHHKEKRRLESIDQFRTLFSSEKSEVNPSKLLEAGVQMHRAHQYASAKRVYEVLVVFAAHSIGSPQFLSKTTEEALRTALDEADHGAMFPDELRVAFEVKGDGTVAESRATCDQAGNLLSALGFFQLSARLYECAYFSESSSKELAAKVVESYWLGKEHRSVFKFVQTVDFLQEGKISPEQLPSVLDDFPSKNTDMLLDSAPVPPRIEDDKESEAI